ncbi:MAG TPA: glycosyltransferase, partial [Steroidobacteraceae bacterium]|nr:glycosyltransferase [Steroidobacteraceae bacterium]
TFVASRLTALSEVADVSVIQPVPYFPVARSLPEWATTGPHTVRGLSIEPAPMFYLPGLLKSLDARWLARSARRRMERLRRQRPIHLIDAHFGYPEGVGCVRLGQALGLPVFVTIRGSETDLLPTAGIGPQLVSALNAADGCISVSHSLRELAIAHGVDAGRIRVIPNAVDRGVFRPAAPEAARRALGLDPAAPLVVSVGHLIAGKRHHLLVRAFAGLRRLHPTAQLAIIGGPAYERAYPRELAKLVTDLGLGSQVRLLGRVPQPLVSTWLQAASVFALATHREGCCNAVLEALATGCPVVTTRVGDNAHFVREGVNGFLVGVDDVESLGGALAVALSRRWDPQAISNGLEVGDWGQVARQVVDFFRERVTAGAAHVLND